MATLEVNDVLPPNQYTATSGQTVFDYDFEIFEDSDLQVYKTPAGQDPNDTSDLLTLTTDYTVTGAGTTGGGTIVLTSGADAGDVITIWRDIPIKRTDDYQTAGDFLASDVNDEEDKQVMMLQQLEAQLGRVPQFARTQNIDSFDTKMPAPLAGRLLKVTDDGTGFEFANASELTAITVAERSEWIGADGSLTAYAFTGATDNGDGTYTLNGLSSDVTGIFHAGRQVKIIGSSTGTVYAEINSSSFSATLSVTVTPRSGSVANEALSVYVGIMSAVNPSTPFYNAAQLPYSNSSSGLSATDVQAAIDEVEGRFDDLENGIIDYPTAGGTGDAITATTGASAYTTDNVYTVLLTADNTGAATINLDSLGAKAIKLLNGNDPSAGNLKDGAIANFLYDGTNMVLLNPETVFTGSDAYPAFACRAWVNFKGTGTVTIRASGNVSSITDNGTGDYTVNFTTAMQDANYSPVVSCSNNVGTFNYVTASLYQTGWTSSAFGFQARNPGGALVDTDYCSVVVLR